MNKLTELITKLNITSNLKYKALTILCIFVHSSIAIFSFIYGITPLLFFNFASILVYIGNSFLLLKHPAKVCYISFVEIILHSFISVILLGNDFGFSMYFILLVPMVYNMLHSTNINHYILKSNVLAILSFILFVTCYIISNVHEPIYSNTSLESIRPFIYVINMLITFFTLSFFSILFILETMTAYNKLYSQNQQLDILANTDHLTGLFNRRTMTEHVIHMLESYTTTKEPFSIIICDVDNFKNVNDTYGHKCGDEVLKTIASTFQELTRDKDFLCRWGGEEFLILLKGTDIEQARIIAERIRVNISETDITYNDLHINITMTFGVASVTEEQDYNILFKLADSRLYTGKKNGKNVVI